MPFVSLILRPPRKKSADLGSSRCEVDIKRVYDAVIRPGNLSNAGLILPTCRLFRLSFRAIARSGMLVDQVIHQFRGATSAPRHTGRPPGTTFSPSAITAPATSR